MINSNHFHSFKNDSRALPIKNAKGKTISHGKAKSRITFSGDENLRFAVAAKKISKEKLGLFDNKFYISCKIDDQFYKVNKNSLKKRFILSAKDMENFKNTKDLISLARSVLIVETTPPSEEASIPEEFWDVSSASNTSTELEIPEMPISEPKPHERNQKGEGNMSDINQFNKKLASTKSKCKRDLDSKELTPLQKQRSEKVKFAAAAKSENFANAAALARGGVKEEVILGEITAGLFYAFGPGIAPMEDTHLAAEIIFYPTGGPALSMKTFAVFDGHSGAKTSKYLEKNFERVFLSQLADLDKSDSSHYYWEDEDQRDIAIRNALKNTFVALHYETEGMRDGSTACVNIILNNKIYTANAGDSRAAYRNKEGLIEQLSWDHDPETCEAAIRSRGGFYGLGAVQCMKGGGQLNVARAIGDHNFLGLTPRPSFNRVEASGGYLITGCDGLWDACHTGEAFDAIDAYLEEKPDATCPELAKHLAHVALVTGSRDNITVIVTKLPE